MPDKVEVIQRNPQLGEILPSKLTVRSTDHVQSELVGIFHLCLVRGRTHTGVTSNFSFTTMGSNARTITIYQLVRR